jgi:hypothetical protein
VQFGHQGTRPKVACSISGLDLEQIILGKVHILFIDAGPIASLVRGRLRDI